MIKPMLAAPMSQAEKKNTTTSWTDWVAEMKYDGIRLMVDNTGMDIKSYTRTRDGLLFDMPPHIKAQFARLAPGWYDGELLGGETSTDVKRKDLRHTLVFVLFDVVMLNDRVIVAQTYDERRATLEKLHAKARVDSSLQLSITFHPSDKKDLLAWVKTIWKNGGEGVILKKRTSLYLADERKPDAWVKIKKVEHASLTLVGFKPSKGTVRWPGHPFAIAHLRDDDGNETTAKIVNDYELKRIEDAWSTKYGQYPSLRVLSEQVGVKPHPWVGKRKVVVEFQQRTRTGGYRGPVLFDRWENE